MPPASNTLLQLPHDVNGLFLDRPNRFLGIVHIEGEHEVTEGVRVHVHDPGRLRELLYPGNRVLLRKATASSSRRTAWDLLAGRHHSHWILIHSGYHRALAERIFSDPAISPFGLFTSLNAEVKRGHSRMDFLGETADGDRILIEVKGCTLAENGTALFPDAPTVRGTRHLNTLAEARKAGMRAAVVMLVFRPEAERFAPNRSMDPAFAGAFNAAVRSGVEVYSMVLLYDGNHVRFLRTIPYDLS